MAAPASKTINDFSGDWVMNRTLSGDADGIMALQGISWMTRKVVNLATVTLHVKQYKDEQGHEHIDIEQTLTGGIPGTTEKRVLNWEWNEHTDSLFGEVKGRSRMCKLSALTDDTPDAEDREWLSKGWDTGDTGDHVQSWAESKNNGWTAQQVWGFQEVDGVRRYCRNVVVRKEDQVKRERLVYDYQEQTA